MLVDRYWSHIQDSQEFIKRIFGFLSVPVYSNNVKFLEFQQFEICKNSIFKVLQWFSWFFSVFRWLSFGFSHKQTEQILYQIEVE